MKTDLVAAGYIIHNGKVLLIHHKKLNLWLPAGGHIEQNETPDETLIREIKEELGIDVEILNKSQVPTEGNSKKQLSLPFCVNVHSVGDHDHCCFFYICKPKNPEQIKIKPDEILAYQWFTKEELNQPKIPKDVQQIGKHALELYENR